MGLPGESVPAVVEPLELPGPARARPAPERREAPRKPERTGSPASPPPPAPRREPQPA